MSSDSDPIETVHAAVVLEAARAPELLTVREFNHLLGAYGVACERSAPTEMKQHGEVVAAYGRALAAAETFSDATDELEAKLAVQAAEIERLRAELAEAKAKLDAGEWSTEYGAVNDITGEFVPFSWMRVDDLEAVAEYAAMVGKEPMQRRVWHGPVEPFPQVAGSEETQG